MVDQTIHQRPRSKFRLPPPVDKGSRDPHARSSKSNSTRSRSSLPLPLPRFNAMDPGISLSNVVMNEKNSRSSNDHASSANNVPGRPRRRQHLQGTKICNGTRNHSDIAPSTKEHSTNQYNLPVPAAVLLWYLLGVVSISSSKVLLSTHEVPPLLLTLQQLIIGVTLLRTLLLFGDNSNDGLQPIPLQNYSVVIEGCSSVDMSEIGSVKRKSNISSEAETGGVLTSVFAIITTKARLGNENQKPHIDLQLLLSAIYFTLGFLFTNYGFRSGSAAFVETIKAAEPITSAFTAVAWGIERLGKEEVLGLSGIVVGVIMSTVGQYPPKSEVKNQSTLLAFLIVMISNLCFSFRGLHQKLLRASPQGKATSINDLNLQFRMQQVGVLLLIGPAAFGNGTWILSRPNLFDLEKFMHYIPFALVNGIAFSSYNLASTYVLTRISVVHHAALNCIRRVFAVIVTSVVFGLSITALQIIGIAVSVGGFCLFSHFKMKKGVKEQRRRDLREKYGVLTLSKWNENKGWSDEKKEADSTV